MSNLLWKFRWKRPPHGNLKMGGGGVGIWGAEFLPDTLPSPPLFENAEWRRGFSAGPAKRLCLALGKPGCL